MGNKPLLNRIAEAFIAGGDSPEEIQSRLALILSRRVQVLQPITERYARALTGKPRPRRREVVRFLLGDTAFCEAWSKTLHKIRLESVVHEPPPMQPVQAASGWDLPEIRTAGDLAEWLAFTPDELAWFADLKGLNPKAGDERLAHYCYRVFVKRAGGIRLIEAPKPRLKAAQRTILTGILERIPAHPAAHGFIKGRSIRTFVAPHVNQRIVLRMDVSNFFPSLTAARIQAFFRAAGYPEAVADLFGGICTNSVPKRVWQNAPMAANAGDVQQARVLYARRHLPQGAPASPALSNICAYRLDCRLAGLARAAGAQYTRYADDLAFSGDCDFERSAERFSTHVAAILAEEGFSAHHRKTRLMRRGVRQHLAGVVINEHANTFRRDFDVLKAILTNCARYGPASQNGAGHAQFRKHLEGRVAFVESINEVKGEKLREIFERIRWRE